MSDLQSEMDEYRDIQLWLRGEKPPAGGRSWRRRVHAAAVAVLPEPAMHRIDTILRDLPPLPSVTLLKLWVGVGILGFGFTVFPAMVGSMGEQSTPAGLPMAGTLEGLETLVMTLQPVVLWGGLGLLIISSCYWLVKGE